MMLAIVLKATVALLLGLGGAALARRSRAAVRHAVLAASFGVLLVLPAASLLAPPVPIAVASAPLAPMLPAPAAISAVPHFASAAQKAPGIPLSSVWMALWIAGTALFLAPVTVGLWQVRRLRRSALPWRHGQSVVDGIAREAGVRGRVELLLHEQLPGPMTCGVWHPGIVLPADAQGWPEEDLRRAIVHELEHVRRGDWLMQCVARAACALYWFHPLAWMAWRRLALEAERSCDDAVLEQSEATAYADQLVGLAQRFSTGKAPVLAMASRADLSRRVGALLDHRQRRGRAGAAAVAMACGAAVVLVTGISPLRLVAAQDAVISGAHIRSASSLVVIPVVVTDANHSRVEGLQQRDFQLTEDDVPQTITLFETQKEDSGWYYLLGYYPKNQRDDGGFRRVKVACKDLTQATVDARAGYYASNPPPAPSSAPVVNAATDPSILPPVLIYKRDANYTEEARKAKYQGTVTLLVEVDVSGKVTSVKVVRGLGLGLDEKAIEAVRQWRFKPGTRDGNPIAVQTQVEVAFRLL